jgi:hypothetical protein
MADQRRLFLHVGTHKTGTTSIQKLLFDRHRDIAARGVRVILDHPSAGREMPANCRSIANAFVRQELWTTQRIRGTEGIALFGSGEVTEHFARQLSASAKHFVLSAEAFCYMRTRTERKHLERFLASVKCEVIPIVYLRKEADWRASWMAQNSGPEFVAFRSRYPERFSLFDDWYFDRNAIVAFWRSISADTIVRDYDEEVANRGSVIPSFLETVGLPLSFDSGEYFLNRRSVRPHRLALRRQPQRLPGRPAK